MGDWETLGLVLGLVIGGIVLFLLLVICSFRTRNPWIKAKRRKVPGNRDPTLPLNQGLYLGTHNSCHVSPMFSTCFPTHWGPAQWRYTHPTIIEQLEDGIRHVEIDTWFNQNTDLWEIFHHFPDPLVNVGPCFETQLRAILRWSEQNAGHCPVWVSLDLKGAYRPLCTQSLATVLGTSIEDDEHLPERALELLEQAVVDVFGERTVSNSELQRGAPCLRDAIMEQGWPSQKELAGRFFFTTAGCCWGSKEAKGSLLKKHRYDTGCSEGGFAPDAAFYEENNCSKVKKLLEGGFCVRTCLFIHDSDHSARDVELLDDLLALGVQYIATNDLACIMDAKSYKKDERVLDRVEIFFPSPSEAEQVRAQGE